MSNKVKTELVRYLLEQEASFLAREREQALLLRDRIKEGDLHRGKDDPFHSPDYYEGVAEGHNEAMVRLYMLRNLISD